MSTLILCAGNQDRFDGGIYKQMLLIHGEPLLFRTIRQCEKGFTSVVTKYGGFNPPSPYQTTCYLMAHQARWTCETIYNTRHLWSPDGQTRILLGDVMFTDEAIATIMQNRESMRFYGDTRDFFAISFSAQYAPVLSSTLQSLVSKCKTPGTAHCRLLHLYRFMGMPDARLVLIGDDTQDFDTNQDYEQWSRGISKNRLKNPPQQRRRS